MDGKEPSENKTSPDGVVRKTQLQKSGSSLYLSVRMPQKSDCTPLPDDNEEDEGPFYFGEQNYIPSKSVQELLATVTSLKHRPRQIFCELDVLKKRGETFEWRELGRWVKYEERVEEGGKRWSKPHVASLSVHYIMELRKNLLEGVFLKEIECYSVSAIIDPLLDEWIRTEKLNPMLRPHIRAIALKPHRHRHEKGRPEDKRKSRVSSSVELNDHASTASFDHDDMVRAKSTISLSSVVGSESNLENRSNSESSINKKYNERFMRKLPKGSETASIMVGEVEGLDTILCGFMRLSDAFVIGQLSEVELPTRFIVYLLGPQGTGVALKEMGRCISTMLVDEIFREVAYKSRNMDDILAGVDEFLEQLIALPPGEWDPSIRIEPPDRVPTQDMRKSESTAVVMEKIHGGSGGADDEGHIDPDLVLTFKPFSGLFTDLKVKLPWYLSDFTDAIHIQCPPSAIFIFLATLTNNVTFGALLGTGTGEYMGVMECIFAGATACVIFALFAGQPLNIIASTGPMLVLENIIYEMCLDNNWNFLSLRFWIGMWTAFFLLIMVIFNLSALVKYITRFTEESFACLIAIIFIYESFGKLSEIAKHSKLRMHPEPGKIYLPECFCLVPSNVSVNDTDLSTTTATPETTTTFTTIASMFFTLTGHDTGTNTTNQTECELEEQCIETGGKWVCENDYVPDAFLMSCILFATTFFIAIFLVNFRTWPCFPTFIRRLIGDFAILIAIIVSVGIDAAIGLPTPKLNVPSEFKPTNYKMRDWLVNPISPENPWWLYIAAGLPAILATILVFMDQQITAVIVNRKEHKLVKGKGYHLDLLIITILVALHSLLGLPWYVAATVNAIAHINSLKKESEACAPGERPSFLGVREQRVTLLIVGGLSFAAVFITKILNVIPMAVLYGVFFYMGYNALTGMQLIDRILLIFMPAKYQPDYPYLRHVQLWRVHVFTFIQVLCLVALWVIKSIKGVSIIFPILVVFTAVVRKIIEVMFTEEELKYIDSLLPKKGKHETKEEEEEKVPEISNGTNGLFTPVKDVKNKTEKHTSFYLKDDSESPPAYDNRGFDTKL